jgi:hypothetical protein
MHIGKFTSKMMVSFKIKFLPTLNPFLNAVKVKRSRYSTPQLSTKKWSVLILLLVSRIIPSSIVTQLGNDL